MSVCFFAAAVSPPPPDLPEILLSAPINATWAANHASEWTTRGIDGFLLHGILDECRGNVWAWDGAPETTGLDDALLLEIRVANARLREAGIPNNFLLTSLPENYQGFQRAEDADALVKASGGAAAFCAGADLRGIALDTQSISMFHHPRWDGYTNPDPAALHAGALDTGRRLYAAMAAAAPDAQLLVLYDGPQSAGPLWPALMSGLLEGAQRARQGSIHLLTRATFDVVDPRALVASLELERAFLALRLDEPGYQTWKTRGGSAPGLRPLAQPMAGGEVYAAYPRESFRTQLAAALLCADQYVWIESAGQTWWQVTPEEAESYAGLHQLGDAVGDQTKPLPSYLAETRATSPLEGLQRVMSLVDTLDEPTILAGAKGAAAVVWPGQPLTLGDDEHARRIIDLGTGETLPRDEEDTRVIAAGAYPILVEGLSVADRLLPASLWLEVDGAAIETWAASLPLHYGFTNHTPFTLEGGLDLFAPARWPAGTDHQEFLLEPSAGVDVSTAARGRWRAGDSVRIRVGVTVSGATPKSRTWSVDVPPRLMWKALFDAPIAGAPLWEDVDTDGTAELVVTTTAGDVACLTSDGMMRWGRSTRPGYAFGAAAGRAPAGWQAIVAVDTAGVLHVLRGDGTRVADVALSAGLSNAPIVADVHEGFGDELVMMSDSGVVQVWRLDGVMLWEQDTGAAGAFVTAIGRNRAQPWVVCAGSEVAVYDGEGEPMGRVALPEVATCAPVVGDLDKDEARDILVGTGSGSIVRIEDEAVTPISIEGIEGTIREIWVAGSDLVLVADAGGVHGLNNDLERLWGYTAPGANVRTAANTIVVSASGAPETVGLNAEGVVEWKDTSALWGPLTAAALDARGEVVRSAVGSGEGVVRVREFAVKH